jgi:glucose/arabinose dehydrogenase
VGGGRGLSVAVLSVCIASACAPGGGIAARPSLSGPAVPLSETVIQSGLIVPWDVAVAADGRMFVTERPGTITVFESTMSNAKRVATTQVGGIHAMGEAGLLGITLDPDFSANQLLYVCASRTDQGEWRNQILRYHFSPPSLTLEGVVLRSGIAAGGVHDACRIRFGPDGKLWIATGDGGVAAHAQDLASLNGKVLRINADGSVPYDNPTLKGQAGPTPVYAIGLRNPGGLAFHPSTGACYITDAGDQMQDEIDLVTSGANFGWPDALGPGGVRRGFEDPLWTSGSGSYAVAGAAFLSGAGWSSWSDSLIVATLKEHDLRRFTIDGTHVLAREVLVDEKYGRLRGATEAPDGALIVTTSNGSGDRIVRIAPAR